MKIKNKGKIHPSPSSSLVLERERDVLSVLKLLPAAILSLASILSLQDKEVLAYMITRSLNTSTNSNQNPNPSSSISQEPKKKSSKKPPNSNPNRFSTSSSTSSHKVPIFDCDCFNCYTSYWFRWDSSPNRELIHQVIEAFEDHLASGEQSRKQKGSKRRDKSGRRVGEKPVLDVFGSPGMGASVVASPEVSGSCCSAEGDVSFPGEGGEVVVSGEIVVPAAEIEDVAADVPSPAAAVSNHKGLARKVLPDVLGILNSRLWSLWNPNV